MKIDLHPGKKLYFASDQHFGSPNPEESRVREAFFLRWLDVIKKDAQVLFLLGDLFDFWHEWKYVVPKGYTRLFAKLIELRESGIDIHFFVGNHDLWMRDYLEKELGICVFFNEKSYDIAGKKFLMAHGDGIGPGDKGYKVIKKLFSNPLCQWLFRWIHPDISMRIGNYLSQRNKLISGKEGTGFLGEDKEDQILYVEGKPEFSGFDYFVFGHRHLPLVLDVCGGRSKYVNLGDWVSHFTYGVFSGKDFELKTFKG